jgi:hypothetical protein
MTHKLVNITDFPDFIVRADDEEQAQNILVEAEIKTTNTVGLLFANTFDYDTVYLRHDLFALNEDQKKTIFSDEEWDALSPNTRSELSLSHESYVKLLLGRSLEDINTYAQKHRWVHEAWQPVVLPENTPVSELLPAHGVIVYDLL